MLYYIFNNTNNWANLPKYEIAFIKNAESGCNFILSSDSYTPEKGDYIVIVTNSTYGILLIKDVSKNNLYNNNTYSNNYTLNCIFISPKSDVISSLNFITKQINTPLDFLSFDVMDLSFKDIIINYESKLITSFTSSYHELKYYKGDSIHLLFKGVIFVVYCMIFGSVLLYMLGEFNFFTIIKISSYIFPLSIAFMVLKIIKKRANEN